MKIKGQRDDYVQAGKGSKHRETTRDERVQIITLREKASMSWKQIVYTMFGKEWSGVSNRG
ncbi:hypothetical protein HOY82DRAFT_597730 [Tuber indicum]|nr:hypothetical protein HOY82DRAFT_597730 [Tuber indicum]